MTFLRPETNFLELPWASEFAKEEAVIAAVFVLIGLFFRHADAATNIPTILRRVVLEDCLSEILMRT